MDNQMEEATSHADCAYLGVWEGQLTILPKPYSLKIKNCFLGV